MPLVGGLNLVSVENLYGTPEIDAVLSQIAFSLLFIPLERHLALCRPRPLQMSRRPLRRLTQEAVDPVIVGGAIDLALPH